MPLPSHVIQKTGPNPGPRIAIFCGIHGNEKAGVMAVDRLAEELEPTAGTVFLVYANPPAMEKDVRLVDANLNRLFMRDLAVGDLYEHKRANELMNLLDTCDALLDLHSYPVPVEPEKGIPFAICETPSLPIAALLDIPIVVNGFTAAQSGGTDGYMHLNGKTGICVELGAIERPDVFVDLGVDCAKKFLSYFGCLEIPTTPREQKRLTLTTFQKRTHEDFKLAKPFRNFDFIASGEPIAYENGVIHVAPCDSYVIFPYDTRPVGIEAFLLAKES